MTHGRRWWGALEVGEEQGASLVVGPCSVWIEHRPHEWRIAVHQSPHILSTDVEVCTGIEPVAGHADAEVHRYAFRSSEALIHVIPATADRSVVVRPQEPFHVLPGQSVDLYMSTALWMRVEATRRRVFLMETPTTRPSDTWFGPSTRAGELCYASRISAHLRQSEIDSWPARAITKVVLQNRARETLRFERFALPVPHLSLYADSADRLWTQSATVRWDSSGAPAQVLLASGPPAEARGASAVGKARRPPTQNVLTQALSALFGAATQEVRGG